MEAKLRTKALSPAELSFAQNWTCRTARGCIRCPNGFQCTDAFGGTRHCLDSVTKVRESIWSFSKGPKHRRSRMLEGLLGMMTKDEQDVRTIQYRINGVIVCKDFYRAAVGGDVKMFNSCVAYVTGKSNLRSSVCGRAIGEGQRVEQSNPSLTTAMREDAEICGTSNALKQPSSAVADCVAFLHAFFNGSVDCAPEEVRVRYTKNTWIEVYNVYVKEHCGILNLKPLHYSVFCATRKQHCSNYRRCRTTRKGGWNHLSCAVCDNLKRLISRCGDEESRKKYEAQLQKHRDYQARQREHYYNTRAKAIRSRNKDDVSMIVDAAGGAGATHSPRYNTTEKNEPARHSLLKVKNTFAKIHGIGTLIFQTLSDVEASGGNLTVEVIVRAVKEVIKQRDDRPIRNLYVQLDNVNSNKCRTVLAGMASLVLLGLVRKVKLSYLLVGHTHEDVDACIGVVVSHLRGEDLPTYERFREECLEAIKKDGSKVLDIQRIVGITDYDAMFTECRNIIGISTAHVVRITANECTDGVDIFYKEDCSAVGWLPRPVAPTLCSEWSRKFKHPTKPREGVAELISYRPVTERGRRREWIYSVRFLDGSVHDMNFTCPSIPIGLTRSTLMNKLLYCKPQQFRGKLMEQECRDTILGNIEKLLTNRGDEFAIESWRSFFADSLPDISDPQPFIERAYEPVLAILATTCAGPIQIPAQYKAGDVDHPSTYVDSVTFPGGPMSAGERKKILQAKNIYNSRPKKVKKAAIEMVTLVRGKRKAEEEEEDYGDEACSCGSAEDDKSTGEGSSGDESTGASTEEELEDYELTECLPKYNPDSCQSEATARELQYLVGKKFRDVSSNGTKTTLFEICKVEFDSNYDTVVGYRRNVNTQHVGKNSYCVYGDVGLLMLTDMYDEIAEEAVDPVVDSHARKGSSSKGGYSYEAVSCDDVAPVLLVEGKRNRPDVSYI